MKRIKNYTSLFISTLFLYALSFSPAVIAQENATDTYIKVYEVIENYPDFSYTYHYENDDLTDVIVKGIPDEQDKKSVETLLIDLKEQQIAMTDKTDDQGIYLYTQEEAEPEEGYEAFYDNLYANLTYPEDAESKGVEGNVYVKFVVNQNGEIKQAKAVENIETPYGVAVTKMKQEAVNAVESTSGKWEPATVNGVPVSEWVVLPVEFEFKINPALKAPIR